MYMPGRRRTASRPSRTVIESALYVPMAMKLILHRETDRSTPEGPGDGEGIADRTDGSPTDLGMSGDCRLISSQRIFPDVMTGTAPHEEAAVLPEMLFELDQAHAGSDGLAALATDGTTPGIGDVEAIKNAWALSALA